MIYPSQASGGGLQLGGTLAAPVFSRITDNDMNYNPKFLPPAKNDRLPPVNRAILAAWQITSGYKATTKESLKKVKNPLDIMRVQYYIKCEGRKKVRK